MVWPPYRSAPPAADSDSEPAESKPKDDWPAPEGWSTSDILPPGDPYAHWLLSPNTKKMNEIDNAGCLSSTQPKNESPLVKKSGESSGSYQNEQLKVQQKIMKLEKYRSAMSDSSGDSESSESESMNDTQHGACSSSNQPRGSYTMVKKSGELPISSQIEQPKVQQKIKKPEKYRSAMSDSSGDSESSDAESIDQIRHGECSSSTQPRGSSTMVKKSEELPTSSQNEPPKVQQKIKKEKYHSAMTASSSDSESSESESMNRTDHGGSTLAKKNEEPSTANQNDPATTEQPVKIPLLAVRATTPYVPKKPGYYRFRAFEDYKKPQKRYVCDNGWVLKNADERSIAILNEDIEVKKEPINDYKTKPTVKETVNFSKTVGTVQAAPASNASEMKKMNSEFRELCSSSKESKDVKSSSSANQNDDQAHDGTKHQETPKKVTRLVHREISTAQKAQNVPGCPQPSNGEQPETNSQPKTTTGRHPILNHWPSKINPDEVIMVTETTVTRTYYIVPKSQAQKPPDRPN